MSQRQIQIVILSVSARVMLNRIESIKVQVEGYMYIHPLQAIETVWKNRKIRHSTSMQKQED